MYKYFLVVILLLSSNIALAGEKNWYRVTVTEGSGTYNYYGTIESDIEQLLKEVEGSSFIHIKDLVYYDNQNRIKSWSDWEEKIIPEVHVRADRIISIFRFTGDPRKKDNP